MNHERCQQVQELSRPRSSGSPRLAQRTLEAACAGDPELFADLYTAWGKPARAEEYAIASRPSSRR
jgi:hypothetical protein